MSHTILRMQSVCKCTGLCKSTIYNLIKAECFIPPVAISERAVGWPDFEVDAVNAARIAEKTEDEIRALVRDLVAARAHIDPKAARTETPEAA